MCIFYFILICLIVGCNKWEAQETLNSTATTTPSGTGITSVCSESQSPPDYKEVNGECLPSCQKKLEASLGQSGMMLGRSNQCDHPIAEHTVNERIPGDQIHDSDLGSCCSIRCIALGIEGITSGITSKHSCGIVGEEKYVQCWGDNKYGQLGNGCRSESVSHSARINYVVKKDNATCYESREVPPSNRLSGVVELALGQYHTCALLENRKNIVCWGRNDKGQLGQEEKSNFETAPVDVFIPNDSVAIRSLTAGDDHNCFDTEGVSKSDRVYCWGNNDKNQVGVSLNQALEEDNQFPEWKSIANSNLETASIEVPHRVIQFGQRKEIQGGGYFIRPECVNGRVQCQAGQASCSGLSDFTSNCSNPSTPLCSGTQTSIATCSRSTATVANGTLECIVGGTPQNCDRAGISCTDNVISCESGYTASHDNDQIKCTRGESSSTARCDSNDIAKYENNTLTCTVRDDINGCDQGIDCSESQATCADDYSLSSSSNGTRTLTCTKTLRNKIPICVPTCTRGRPECLHPTEDVDSESVGITLPPQVLCVADGLDDNGNETVGRSFSFPTCTDDNGTKYLPLCDGDVHSLDNPACGSVQLEAGNNNDRWIAEELNSRIRAERGIECEEVEVATGFTAIRMVCQQSLKKEKRTDDGIELEDFNLKSHFFLIKNTKGFWEGSQYQDYPLPGVLPDFPCDKLYNPNLIDDTPGTGLTNRGSQVYKEIFGCSLSSGVTEDCRDEIIKYQKLCEVEKDKWHKKSANLLERTYIDYNFDNTVKFFEFVNAGNHHTCAKANHDDNNKLYCWGDNSKGQLGQKTMNLANQCVEQGPSSSAAPLVVKDSIRGDVDKKITGVEQIAIGVDFTCVRMRDTDNNIHKIKCWGTNSDNVIPESTRNVCYPYVQIPQEIRECEDTTPSSLDTEVLVDLEHVTDIASGTMHTCLTRQCNPDDNSSDKQEVLCFGSNSEGQLGRLRESSPIALPVTTDQDETLPFTDPDPNSLNANQNLTCVTKDERVYCWGTYSNPFTDDNIPQVIIPQQHHLQCTIPSTTTVTTTTTTTTSQSN